MTYHLFKNITHKVPSASTNRLDILRHKAAQIKTDWIIRHGFRGPIVLSRRMERAENDNRTGQACFNRAQRPQGNFSDEVFKQSDPKAISTVANTGALSYTKHSRQTLITCTVTVTQGISSTHNPRVPEPSSQPTNAATQVSHPPAEASPSLDELRQCQPHGEGHGHHSSEA